VIVPVHARIATIADLALFKTAATAALSLPPAIFLPIHTTSGSAAAAVTGVPASEVAVVAAAVDNAITPPVPPLVPPPVPPLLSALAVAASVGLVPAGIVDAFEATPVHAAAKFRIKVLMALDDRRLVDDVVSNAVALLTTRGFSDALGATSLDVAGLKWSVEEVRGVSAPPPPLPPPDTPPAPPVPPHMWG